MVTNRVIWIHYIAIIAKTPWCIGRTSSLSKTFATITIKSSSSAILPLISVPKTLMSSDPVSLYTPQEVAIGPYHHLRPELHEMERYKLAAARRAQRQFHGDHKLHSETLAWMMAIDASFLLEFLQIYAMKDDKLPATSSSISISHLFDYARMKAAHNAILRDMSMLENQIP
ncbi:hypothetical protein CUMW_252790 [Citrus unshiu]|uniref:Uncharacterized protein n=1 Tax=Citrus unshiu TaxID=55188 RepID=A0A2H5QQP5_CITUN|nr:hypothetical protein CUMW_252790 [Citrus unshiu]